MKIINHIVLRILLVNISVLCSANNDTHKEKQKIAENFNNSSAAIRNYKTFFSNHLKICIPILKKIHSLLLHRQNNDNTLLPQLSKVEYLYTSCSDYDAVLDNIIEMQILPLSLVQELYETFASITSLFQHYPNLLLILSLQEQQSIHRFIPFFLNNKVCNQNIINTILLISSTVFIVCFFQSILNFLLTNKSKQISNLTETAKNQYKKITGKEYDINYIQKRTKKHTKENDTSKALLTTNNNVLELAQKRLAFREEMSILADNAVNEIKGESKNRLNKNIFFNKEIKEFKAIIKKKKIIEEEFKKIQPYLSNNKTDNLYEFAIELNALNLESSSNFQKAKTMITDYLQKTNIFSYKLYFESTSSPQIKAKSVTKLFSRKNSEN